MPRLSMVLELISLLAQPVLMALFWFFLALNVRKRVSFALGKPEFDLYF